MALAGRSCRTRTDRETIAFGEPTARVEVELDDADERPTFLGRSAARTAAATCSTVPRWPGAGRRSARRSPSSSPTASRSSRGRPRIAARTSTGSRRAVARARGGPPALRPGARAAKRAARRVRAGRRAAPTRSTPGTLELAAAGIDLIGDARARPSNDWRRSSRRRGRDLGLPGTPRVAVPAALRCDRRGRARRRARRAPRARISSAATPSTARTSTSSRSSSASARCGATAPRASSEPRSSPCCSPSAARCSTRGRPPPLMLLDDVMSELDPDRRGLLVGAARRGRGPGADHRHRAATPARPARAHEIAMRDGRPRGGGR